MHGLINSAFQGFISETYGDGIWREVRSQADLPFEEFEAMLSYPDHYSVACLNAASEVLHRSAQILLEDFGTFVVVHPPFDKLRRLLRFGGASFPEFLQSLEEISERGRLVMPELEMPEIAVMEKSRNHFTIRASWRMGGIGPILIGSLRAMADDYGTLAYLELQEGEDGAEELHVILHDMTHAEDRGLDLGEVSP